MSYMFLLLACSLAAANAATAYAEPFRSLRAPRGKHVHKSRSFNLGHTPAVVEG